ncbi:MAG TPA: NADH-quinone oxidoreductase subunit M [Chloroflexota bacterium]|nr:NADH-quinone oxidoreductase subunit M [Chloroflexota bacterium]
MPWITVIILVPLAGALALAAVPVGPAGRLPARLTAIAAALATLVLVAILVGLFDRGSADLQYVDHHGWAEQAGLTWDVGVDGISIWLLLLTAGIFLLAVAAACWRLPERPRGFLAMLLLAEAALLGLFAAGDLVLFYVFWEAMLVPFYFLIGMWGDGDRVKANVRFVIYTMVGSLLMLVAILATAFVAQSITGQLTFSIRDLQGVQFTDTQSTWLFAAFALAFAIKVPIWPLHTWLPDLYTQTPLGAMVLITMLAKVGAFGFLRFAIPLFPAAAAQFAPLFAILGLVGIIYGGLTAFTQRDLVGVIAYSSIAHLGFVVLGIFSLTHAAVQGAVVQMVNHGISAGALFLIAAMIYQRVGSTEFARLGGISAKWPVLGTLALVVVLSSTGMPGLNGFVGEFLIVYGALANNWVYAAVAAVGIVIAAVYLISMYRRAMHGPAAATLVGPDVSGREVIALLPLLALIFVIGIYPAPLLNSLEDGVNHVTAQVHTAQVALPPVALVRDAGSAR